MDDYIIILNYLRGNMTYTIDLGGYILPKYIEYGSINLYKSRSDELLRRSSYVKNFENSLGKKDIVQRLFSKSFRDLKYLERIVEFPLPIENRNFWENILTNLGISSKEKAIWETRYFKLDYLFPYLGCCIEIDSDYHLSSVRALYDKARDMYLLGMYGLRTVRLLKFGENQKNLQLNLKILQDYISEITNIWSLGNSLPRKIVLDFSKTIVEGYIYNNRFIYEIITAIRSDLGMKFQTERKISVDLSKYTSDIKLREKVRKELRYVFGKEII